MSHFYSFFCFLAHSTKAVANLYFRPTSFSFEIPQTCLGWAILFGANPVLYMIFVFMQMYYIFMHSRINIHKNKVRNQEFRPPGGPIKLYQSSNSSYNAMNSCTLVEKSLHTKASVLSKTQPKYKLCMRDMGGSSHL